MIQKEIIISDELMSLAMEFRFHVIDEIKKVRKNVVIPQLRAGAGHHRSFSIVPGGNKTVTIHVPTTRKREYEFFSISVMDLFEAHNPDAAKKLARGLGGVAPSMRHVDIAERFTGDTDADPFRGRFSLGALYDVATAIRRGGNIGEEVNMEFEAKWSQDRLNQIVIHLVYPQVEKGKLEGPEVFGKRIEPLATREAKAIGEACLELVKLPAEERFRISPSLLDPYIQLDDAGTRVLGIGLRRWLD